MSLPLIQFCSATAFLSVWIRALAACLSSSYAPLALVSVSVRSSTDSGLAIWPSTMALTLSTHSTYSSRSTNLLAIVVSCFCIVVAAICLVVPLPDAEVVGGIVVVFTCHCHCMFFCLILVVHSGVGTVAAFVTYFLLGSVSSIPTAPCMMDDRSGRGCVVN